MNVKTTKRISLSVEDIEQAVAEFLSREHSGVMQASTTFAFYEYNAPEGSESLNVGELEVIIKETQ